MTEPFIPIIDPTKTIFMVMDFQNAIVGMFPGATEITDRAATAIDSARKAGIQIGYIQVAFNDADYAAIPETNKGFSALASSRRMSLDDPSAAIHSTVAPQQGDMVFRKVRVGAFSTTGLGAYLKENGIDTLILAGLSTSGVVLSTVRDAADNDYRVYVLEDGCGDPDPEVHRVLMEKVFPRQTYVIKIEELAELLP